MALVLTGHAKDLGGGFVVRRMLPAVARQSVGPFVFLDHFGPLEVPPGANNDVRPHPHIGLATVTWLYEGAMMHRDSLGCAQRIEPGAINWMTAGRGIVHSERTPEDLRGTTRRMHGIQLWAALPPEHEEADPAFVHTPAAAIPVVEGPGWVVRVAIGTFGGVTSPVATFSPTLALDVTLAPGASVELDAPELGIYPVEGRVSLDGEPLAGAAMGYVEGRTVVASPGGARVFVVGGAPLAGRRRLWWNFVSTRPERIREAAEAWAADQFPPVPGETERIPLPTTPLPG